MLWIEKGTAINISVSHLKCDKNSSLISISHICHTRCQMYTRCYPIMQPVVKPWGIDRGKEKKLRKASFLWPTEQKCGIPTGTRWNTHIQWQWWLSVASGNLYRRAQENQPIPHLTVVSSTRPGLPTVGVLSEPRRAYRTHMLNLNWATAC